jgi:hypothetical protein
VDEVGYLSYSNRHADLLFEIVSRRYEAKSTLITTNRPSTLIEKDPLALKKMDPPSAHWMTAGVGWLRARQAAVVVRFPKKPDHDRRLKCGSESADVRDARPAPQRRMDGRGQATA